MVHKDRFTVSSTTRDRTRWITLTGEFDLATAASLHDQVDVAADARPRTVVLDLSGLTFMDCAALRAVIRFAGQARFRGWQLRIVGPPPRVARIVTLTGAAKLLPPSSTR